MISKDLISSETVQVCGIAEGSYDFNVFQV